MLQICHASHENVNNSGGILKASDPVLAALADLVKISAKLGSGDEDAKASFRQINRFLRKA